MACRPSAGGSSAACALVACCLRSPSPWLLRVAATTAAAAAAAAAAAEGLCRLVMHVRTALAWWAACSAAASSASSLSLSLLLPLDVGLPLVWCYLPRALPWCGVHLRVSGRRALGCCRRVRFWGRHWLLAQQQQHAWPSSSFWACRLGSALSCVAAQHRAQFSQGVIHHHGT